MIPSGGKRGKRGLTAHSEIWSVRAGGLAALKWILPLMVKSIRNGDSVARLQTATNADYNGTTPLPQQTKPHLLLQTPPPHAAFLDEV